MLLSMHVTGQRREGGRGRSWTPKMDDQMIQAFTIFVKSTKCLLNGLMLNNGSITVFFERLRLEYIYFLVLNHLASSERLWRSSMLLMVQKSGTTWDVSNPGNTGIKDQHQLVSRIFSVKSMFQDPPWKFILDGSI